MWPQAFGEGSWRRPMPSRSPNDSPGLKPGSARLEIFRKEKVQPRFTEGIPEKATQSTTGRLMSLNFSRKQLTLLIVHLGLLASSLCLAQPAAFDSCPLLAKGPSMPGDPHPQPRPKPSTLTLAQDGGITVAKVATSGGCFPESDPFRNPPGTNFLPSVYTNAFDGNGKEMLNTLPSTPMTPYNLHDGEPVVSKINPASPT